MAYIIPDARFEMPELFEPGRKPVGAVEIIQNQWTDSMIACAPLNGNFDAISKTHGVNNDTKFEANKLIGNGVDGDYTEYQNFNTPDYPFTVVVVFNVATIDSYFSRLFSTCTNNDINYYGLSIYTRTTAPRIAVRIGAGVGSEAVDRRNIEFNPLLEANKENNMVVKITNATTGILWFNGVAFNVSDLSGTYLGNPISGVTRGLTVAGGSHNGNDVRGCDGNIHNVSIFDDALPDSLCQSLSLNPYQFLIPA